MGNLVISDKAKQVYLERLIGKLFKILPMFEEQDKIVPKVYVHALVININSANDLFDGVLIDIVIKLNELYISNEISHKEVKRLVLGCTNFATRLLQEIIEKIRLEGLVQDGQDT